MAALLTTALPVFGYTALADVIPGAFGIEDAYELSGQELERDGDYRSSLNMDWEQVSEALRENDARMVEFWEQQLDLDYERSNCETDGAEQVVDRKVCETGGRAFDGVP